MLKRSKLRPLAAFAAILMLSLVIVPSVPARPFSQSEPLNPEPDEYYRIQCETNAIWVWSDLPIPMLVSLISILQIAALGDGDSFVATNDLTVSRSGDTITITGTNGNRSPEAGSKSFSLNECIERLGGLPELPSAPTSLTDAQTACLGLRDEAEVTRCLAEVTPEATDLIDDPCESTIYANTHLSECYTNPCDNLLYRANNLESCPDLEDTSIGILFSIVNACFNPVGAVAIIASFAGIRKRGKRK